MDIWHYHADDGRLLGAGRAYPDQMQTGHWLVPAWATTIAPPTVGAGQQAHFNGAAWVVVPVAEGA